MTSALRGDEARELSERLLKLYYNTVDYPWTRHHIDSYDQFLSSDLPAMIRTSNPITVLEEQIGATGEYAYKAEIFVGGLEGNKLYIGTPTLNLQHSSEVRLLFPNEARLRNLTYGSIVQADIYIRITRTQQRASGEGPGFTTTVLEMDPATEAYAYLAKYPLFRIPVMLHSRYCILNKKPEELLREAGECIYDYGGYFIVDGSEKVLITHQEQAFNTLYVQNQEREPKTLTYGSISCLSPVTRQVRRVVFGLQRREKTLQVGIPFVRKPIPVFILFRALGIQADEDIIRLIFPDPEDAETKLLEPLLEESVVEAFPFLDTFSAIQYIKILTKGFSEAHVLDVIHNQLFIHVEDRPMARAFFLAECVRKMLRVTAGLDVKTDRDDTRNQRCLSSGFLTRMMFQGVYTSWLKFARVTIDKEYKYNSSGYKGDSFANLFSPGNLPTMLGASFITDGIMRAFKGKWTSGSGAGVGEEKAGVLQALSRLSYMDFLSHCRRVVLDFDTGMKLQGPRRLHTSQFGYFCTNETPGGASIGITKNLTNLAGISVLTNPLPFTKWLLTRAGVISCEQVTAATAIKAVPVFVNAGIVGYTTRPLMLRGVIKLMKWTGCLPATTSIGFSIRERRVFVFLDEGRPVRPLIHLGQNGAIPVDVIRAAKTWQELVTGNYKGTAGRAELTDFFDPLKEKEAPSLEAYRDELVPHAGVIEYVDPYEANESYVACFPEHIHPDTSHLEIHPSTIFGLMTSVIPYANHNQSPRNQLSCSQSKQGVSVYATNFNNRFDNQVHVLSYAEAPIVRTHYYDYVAGGNMGYGQNIVLAMGCFSGYNQEDGIVMNADAIQRGLFHSASYRSYEAFEEDDPQSHTSTRIANPANMPAWTKLKAGVDYSKLDERGIIRVGEFVDESTVLVGRYLQSPGGDIRDASVTAQVWTTGRVEKVAVMISNTGLALVKIRTVQYRVPELGDKFSNRHGQKGTIGMMIRGHDMPRSASGLIPDMIMNSHAIPSRMTMAQLLEALLGKAAAAAGAIGNATSFMNEGSPAAAIGKVLQEQFGMQPMGEELLYDGQSGIMIPSTIFMGNVYTMRLKHMTEDKWNARAEGRKEQRTHQPTGGRGAQGGLRMGEMERDAVIGHSISAFVHESYMKRADGTTFTICNGCGTVPIYNEKTGLCVCPMCDGPLQYIGSTATNLELLPPVKRSLTSFSKIEMPYATKLLEQELSSYMNIGMRILTNNDLQKLEAPEIRQLSEDEQLAALSAAIPTRVLVDTVVPELVPLTEEQTANLEDLSALSAIPPPAPLPEEVAAEDAIAAGVNATGVNATGVNANGPLPPIQEGELEEFDTAALPLATPVQQPQQQQPYIVIPMNSAQAQAFGPTTAAVPGQQNAPPPPPQQAQIALVASLAAPPPATVLPPPIPGAPPMISVDTSPAAFQAQGLPQQQQPIRSALRNNASNRNNGTRKVGFASNQANGAPPPAANVRINVIKRE
jgi:DNA-directed RNA polymerase II subunit RPB2